MFGSLDIDKYLANNISIDIKDQNGNLFSSQADYAITAKDSDGRITTIFYQRSSMFTGTQYVMENGQAVAKSIDELLNSATPDKRDENGLRYIDSLGKLRELTVLHELFHASQGTGSNDAGDEKKTADINRQIGEKCFK